MEFLFSKYWSSVSCFVGLQETAAIASKNRVNPVLIRILCEVDWLRWKIRYLIAVGNDKITFNYL
jgi:hypothetical protein